MDVKREFKSDLDKIKYKKIGKEEFTHDMKPFKHVLDTVDKKKARKILEVK